MAEGGYVSGKKSENERLDESKLQCCVCMKNNVKTQADKYCTDCLDYFCRECVKMHDLWPGLSDHVILDRADIRHSINSTRVLQLPTQRCLDHQDKIVDMYCKTHHQVGCTTCIALYHDK